MAPIALPAERSVLRGGPLAARLDRLCRGDGRALAGSLALAQIVVAVLVVLLFVVVVEGDGRRHGRRHGQRRAASAVVVAVAVVVVVWQGEGSISE